MSLFSNKSSRLFRKSKEIIQNELNKIKTNRNNYAKSLNHPKINNFLKQSNKRKFSNLYKNKSNFFPKIAKENMNISKIKKGINLKNYLITNKIIVPSNNLFCKTIQNNTRNHNIINQFTSQIESKNKTSNEEINNITSVKNNIKRYFFKNFSIQKKNNKNKNTNNSFNSFSLNEKIKYNKKIFKYHSDKKDNNNANIFNRVIKKQNPLKLFLVKNNFSNLEDCPKLINDSNPIYNHNKKYFSNIRDYYGKTEAGTDIFGKTKINQDSFLTLLNIYNLKNFSVFGVLDGHGINGHLVSKYAKNYFQNFFANIDNNEDHDENLIYNKLINQEIMKEKIKLLENFLLEKPFSIQYSGTTCIIIIYIKDEIICYNIGDSRAVYVNKDYKCIPISIDHKPEIPKEKSRIEENEGIVKKDYLNNRIYRVWDKNGKYPGLAMSRSIGDYVAKSLGVINEPELYEINLIQNDVKTIILGSDGLWDAMKYNQIEKIVEEYIIKDDCVGCVNTLIDKAKKINKKRNISCDDITVIVIFFDIKK